MVADVQHFAATIPANTPKATPVTLPISMPPRIVRAVRVRIPPGPEGTTGFALSMAGTAIIPSNAGAYYVGDDEAFVWPLDNQPDSGAWQVRGYNTDTNPHTIQFTFLLDLPQRPATGGLPSPLEITA